jgi:diguanylate cyclase (GGDEF)-like protein
MFSRKSAPASQPPAKPIRVIAYGVRGTNAMPLDVPTLFTVAVCITALLGLFLLLLWMQDRSIKGLGWWGAAYLIGAAAVALWLLDAIWPGLFPHEIASALLFMACGMIWSGARAFHGRRVMSLALSAGALIWLVAFRFPLVAEWEGARTVLSSLIITTYAVLTAVELRLDRRAPRASRVHMIAVPVLHGAMFLSPMVLSGLLSNGAADLDRAWFALFALLTLLYVVGTAFIVVVMAKEHSLVLHKTAALTDPLTGLFNRRGFLEAAQKLAEKQRRKAAPVTVLMFDLDHFKSINDRFGHALGDDTLRVFVRTVSTNMRSGDIVGRLGGEEFAAILPGGIAPAAIVAERVRLAFQAAGLEISGHAVGATVSIGAASSIAGAGSIKALLANADAALYRAKAAGRNRIETGQDASVASARPPAPAGDRMSAKPEPELAAAGP